MRFSLPCCFCIVLLGITPMSFGQTAFVNSLMPVPRSVQAQDGGEFPLTADTTFAVQAPSSAALRDAASRFVKRLQDETGITFTQPFASDGRAGFVIQVANVQQTLPSLHADESYTIDSTSGSVRVHAATLFGAYHAMETLLQLVQSQAGSFVVPAVHIDDAPRFPWRGLMIDTGRHFMPVSVILRTLDGMAAVKLNVLHFHLSEDQGFRIESKRFPKLTQMGSQGLFYTQDQIRTIVAYAAARGIRVVPEFDMPGHSTSWFVGYPELASARGPYKVEHTFGVLDAAMDPTRESTYVFLDEFFGEMATLFPDQYVHIGGDESNGKQWLGNPAIVHFMKLHRMADTHALQAYFNKRVQAILARHGRKMIGWDEVLHPDLSPDVVVQNWHGPEFLISAARQGHLGIYSQPYYLDHAYSAAQMYLKDPVPDGSGLTPEQTKRILGGEACMWSEMVTPANVDSRIWPRAAAVAERFWSPQHVRDTDDMYRRLHVESLRLDALGLEQISGPNRLLRQLAQQRNPQALITLAATLSPPDFGARVHHQHPTQEMPFTDMVDAVVFDPPLQHDLGVWVNAYLADRDGAAQHRLQGLFASWVSASAALETSMSAEQRMQVLSHRATELGQLGHIGLDALAAHGGGRTMTETQVKNAEATFQHVSPVDDSLTEFVVLDPLRKLVAATAR